LHITIRQLQVFESVARYLNYTRVAEELHLTQPAVSMQVRQLEQSVEMPLFEQIGRKIYRTKAGEIMLGYALTIQERLALAKRDNGRAQGD